MNLSQFKVIPQSNVRKGEAKLENLKPLFVPEVVKPDLIFNEESERFFITLKFIKEQNENQGFTAITDNISTYLIRTTEEDVNEDIRPKFFRGNKTQYATSDYLRLLTKELGNDLFLHETKIENYQAFLVSNNVNSFTTQSVIENNIENNFAVTENIIEIITNYFSPIETEIEKAVATEESLMF